MIVIGFVVFVPACIRAPICSTRRKYFPVGLTPASLLATVVQTGARVQTYHCARFEMLVRKGYG